MSVKNNNDGETYRFSCSLLFLRDKIWYRLAFKKDVSDIMKQNCWSLNIFLLNNKYIYFNTEQFKIRLSIGVSICVYLFIGRIKS